MTAASALVDRDASLLDLLDRLLEKGVVISGQVVLSVADVDLVYLDLRALLGSIEPLREQSSDLRVLRARAPATASGTGEPAAPGSHDRRR